ncbi:MAG: sugar transferase [Minisyncoccia bacterium]
MAFIASLWLTLLVRYAAIPDVSLIKTHFEAFAVLFALWLLVFYMAGLYGKRIVLSKSALFGTILKTQLANIVLAALFFFFLPDIGIAPKTNLILYLGVSLALILLWRLWVFPYIARPVTRTRAALIASGPDADALVAEVNGNPRYRTVFSVVVSPEEAQRDFDEIAEHLRKEHISLLVVDTSAEALRALLPRVYELALIAPGYGFADFHGLYEEVFDRVPLSNLSYEWFLENVSATPSFFYPTAKRVIDLVGGVMMGLVTLIATPLVACALALEGPGPVFIRQERMGRRGTLLYAYKFRSMRQNKSASGEWTVEEKKDNPVTKVGAFLRFTSLDEFPQFVNVLKGELSLVGPRNDVVGLGERLGAVIPYYGIRYIVTPGITGWAQINQHYEQGNISPQSIEETKVRLAYDFYYIKHRSLALDFVIALKTVKRMLFRMTG